MTERQTYSSAHWPLSGGYEDRLPNKAELMDVAIMEKTFREAANQYALAGNYDFAQRVVLTGGEIVELGIRVISGAPGEERQRNIRSIWGIREQVYESSLERARIPYYQWHEYFGDADTTCIPQELLELYRSTWGRFAKDYGIEHIKLGYDQHH